MAPLKTRSSKKEENEAESEADAEIISKELPKSDEEYSRKFVLLKENTAANSQIILLNHPKEGASLFRLSENEFDEVLTVDDGFRSWFYGNSVIENGEIHMFAPYNSNFVVLPYFYKKREKFLEIEEILKCDKHKEIKKLINNEKIMKKIELIADVKDVIDTKVYRFNKEKTLKWIGEKFENMKKELAKESHKSLVENDEAFDRYVFGILNDFLSEEISTIVKMHLNIKEAKNVEVIDMSMKRKILDEEDEIPKPVIKKPKESITSKKLQAASKGTKSISSFFGKK